MTTFNRKSAVKAVASKMHWDLELASSRIDTIYKDYEFLGGVGVNFVKDLRDKESAATIAMYLYEGTVGHPLEYADTLKAICFEMFGNLNNYSKMFPVNYENIDVENLIYLYNNMKHYGLEYEVANEIVNNHLNFENACAEWDL